MDGTSHHLADRRRDDAARAAWLYFIGGRTQDEIALQLDLSRQAVQRLVALAVSEKLIKFRLDYPIASCTELAASLTERYELEFCDVVPGDPDVSTAMAGIAVATAMRLQRLLSSKAPTVVCVGTGRTLRAAVEELDSLDRPQHKVVSLVGAMAAAGHGSPYDVVMHLGDKIGARRYPMPAPVLTDTIEDRQALQKQRAFTVLRELREHARASFVGISQIDWHVGLAKKMRACLLKSLDNQAIFCCPVVPELLYTPGSWCSSQHIGFLYRHRHPMQRAQPPAACSRLVCGKRCTPSTFESPYHNSVNVVIQALNTFNKIVG